MVGMEVVVEIMEVGELKMEKMGDTILEYRKRPLSLSPQISLSGFSFSFVTLQNNALKISSTFKSVTNLLLSLTFSNKAQTPFLQRTKHERPLFFFFFFSAPPFLFFKIQHQAYYSSFSLSFYLSLFMTSQETFFLPFLSPSPLSRTFRPPLPSSRPFCNLLLAKNTSVPQASHKYHCPLSFVPLSLVKLLELSLFLWKRLVSPLLYSLQCISASF